MVSTLYGGTYGLACNYKDTTQYHPCPVQHTYNVGSTIHCFVLFFGLNYPEIMQNLKLLTGL